MNSIPKSDSILPVFKDLLLFCLICSINSKKFIRASKAVHAAPSCLLWSHLLSSCLLCKISLLPKLPCLSMTPFLYKDHFPSSKWLLSCFSSRQTHTHISQPHLDVPWFHSFPVFSGRSCSQPFMLMDTWSHFPYLLLVYYHFWIRTLSTELSTQYLLITYADEDFKLRKCFEYLSDIIWRFFNEI